MKRNEQTCMNCDTEGGDYIVVCKGPDCGALHADETECNPYIETLETIQALATKIRRAQKSAEHGTQAEIFGWQRELDELLEIDDEDIPRKK